MGVGRVGDIERIRQRVHDNVVERMTVVRGANMVNPVDRVDPVANDSRTAYNFLTGSDEFYDKLKNLRKEYESFYHDQQELEKAIKELEYDDSIVENMGKLVGNYNNAIESLKSFDYDFGTSYYSRIVNIINDFKVELFRIGIIRGSDNKLIYDKEKFKEKLNESDDAFKFIFEPVKGLIIRLYKAFKNIKIPKFEEELEGKYREHMDYEGIILDEKG
ncbi:hypothetical protein EUAN_15490 [Andreesenia angusta]|uniref:Uncharacterized protein n=1 Tax=Andreesenia angusta TaxID=39480 RepID=A0A1S1V620_9FIRM|nr:hypothetical protein [Andreesenia angusta]OHW62101.1 hypothetical protein EUAN_15490 [Andreesenia angusta]